MSRPDVSVLIPTYNRKTYLQQAVKSCFAGNDEIDVEVIIVDDGSTDGTCDYLQSLDDSRITVLFQNQRGPQVARNRGMEQVRGRYFKQLDDDDYLLAGSLQREVEVLDQSGCPICYGDPLVRSEEEDERRRTLPDHEDLLVAISSGGVPTWNLIFLLDTDIAKRCTWNEGLDHLHILSYLLAFCRYSTQCVRVDRPVAVHRIHSGKRVSDWAEERAVEREREYEMYYSVLEDMDVTPKQKAALLQAMWREIHIIAPLDWTRARKKIQDFERYWPQFFPNRNSTLLSLLDQAIGPYQTERTVNPLRILSAQFSSRGQ